MTRLVVAVDGGNSKTDVALLNEEGALLSWVRGPGSALGPRRTAAVVTRLAAVAARDAGLTPAELAGAHACCCLAGADLPGQVAALHTALTADGVWGSVEVRNDAWALLRTGAAQGVPAVGVVCGAGLKCVARADDDRRFEFPGLGWQSGDLVRVTSWPGRRSGPRRGRRTVAARPLRSGRRCANVSRSRLSGRPPSGSWQATWRNATWTCWSRWCSPTPTTATRLPAPSWTAWPRRS
ncbi:MULTISPECIES: hypothetical protein [Streptomyces]|uniref:ATPase n=1 Tax=Streptomyces flaveolus TaxID=67297 RepID=A0ABV3AMG7_9ACTN|nr:MULTISPECIES: hypothetical protein [Streptomyces]